MASAKCRILCRALPLVLVGAATAAVLGPCPAAGGHQPDPDRRDRIAGGQAGDDDRQRTAAVGGARRAVPGRPGAVQQFQVAVATTQSELAAARATVKTDRTRLAKDAVFAYVFDEPANRLDSTFLNSPTQSVARNQYEDVVMGNIDYAVGELAIEQGRLAEPRTISSRARSRRRPRRWTRSTRSRSPTSRRPPRPRPRSTRSRARWRSRSPSTRNSRRITEAAYAACPPDDAASSASRNATLDATVAVTLVGPGAAQAVTAANNAAAASGAPPVAGTHGRVRRRRRGGGRRRGAARRPLRLGRRDAWSGFRLLRSHPVVVAPSRRGDPPGRRRSGRRRCPTCR